MVDIIIKSFDIWTDAQGVKSKLRIKSIDNISLEGIVHLRELILQLGIQGKLVSQDSNDENAAELIKNITKKREKLLKVEGRKKSEELPPLQEAEIPFKLPKGWQFERIGNLMELINGRAFKPTEWALKGYPIIRIQNLNDRNAPFNYCNFDVEKKFYVKDNDLLIGWSGTPGTSFGAFIWDRGDAVLNQHIFKAEQYHKLVLAEYLKLAINSSLNEMIARAHGGVGLQHITKGKFEQIPLPIPPVSEQKRIVTKVNELMVLCVQLEKQQTNHLKTHQQLVKTLLETLIQAKDADEVQGAWRQLLPHFDTLFCTEDSIEQLRQTILQLAIMGRLVKLETKEEPVNDLIKKIDKEKLKLIKAGKIKNEKPLPEINKNEEPFKLPKGWQWTRLGNVTNYGTLQKVEPGKVTTDTWVLELEDVEKGSSKLINKNRNKRFQSSKNKFSKGDVIYGKLRPYLDKVLVADEDGVCTTEMIPIRGYLHIVPEYLKLVLKTNYFITYATNSTHGMNLPRLGTDKARLALFPLTSETEQKRIVDKVKELMIICDCLKNKIIKSKEMQSTLSKTIVENALT